MAYTQLRVMFRRVVCAVIFGLAVNPAYSATVYEDAEDGSSDRWAVLDDSPAGAVVSNLVDSTNGGRVIHLDGFGTSNSYLIGGFNSSTGWNNATEHVLGWRMRSNASFIINVRLNTELGVRYIRYKNTDALPGVVGNTIDQGLGSESADGTWRSFTRDLDSDLKSGEPSNTVLAVNGILVRGNIEIDDVGLSASLVEALPEADAGADQVVTFGDIVTLDGQGSVANQNPITSYSWLDSSGSIVATGEVATIADLAVGSHTFVLMVANSQGVTDTDSVEIRVVESNVATGTIYEDAEDGSISRWEIRDDVPSGATIDNVSDTTLGSRAIVLSGSGKSNAYLLGSLGTSSGWNNTSEFVLGWDMFASSEAILNVRIETVSGTRYLRYTNSSEPVSKIGSTVDIGLGDEFQVGEWRSYSRDLDQDLKLYSPEDSILAVHGFWIRGDVSLDNIGLSANQTEVALVAQAGSDQTIEFGESVTLDASGSIAGSVSPIASYQWLESNVLLSEEVSPTIGNLAVGVHSITLVVTDEAGGTSSDTVQVTVGEAAVLLQAEAGSDQTIEFGESVTLDASGSIAGSVSPIASYQWLESNVLLSEEVSPTIGNLAVGVHSITLVVTDEAGGTSSDTVQITVGEAAVLLQAQAGDDQTIEFGESVTLDASGSVAGSHGQISSYKWLDGETLLSEEINPIIVGLSVGSYSITLVVTDEAGNTSSDTVQVTVNEATVQLQAAAGDDQTIEFGESVTLDASGSVAGSNSPIVNYQWLDGETLLSEEISPIIVGLSVGSYSITLVVTDEAGGTSSDIVQLTVNDATMQLQAEAGVDQTIEFGESVMLDASASVAGSSPIASYQWLDGETILSEEINSIVIGLPVGLYSITLVVTDEAGGTSSDIVQVTVNETTDLLQAEAGDDQTIEFGEGVTLDASGSVAGSSSPIASYQWLEGEVLLSEEVSPTIGNLGEGVHSITLVVTDQAGGTSSDTVQVTVNASTVLLHAEAGEDQSLELGESVTLDGSGSIPGSSPIASYQWSNGSSLLANGVNPSISNLPVGLHSLTLVVTDEAGASDSDTVQISINSASNEIYVDVQNGDDANSGDILNPFKSIASAVQVLDPGMTLFLREGIYFEKEISVNRSGTAEAPIVIKSYPGETVIVDGGYPEFLTPSSGSWELVDSELQLYRSVGTNYNGGIAIASMLTADGSAISLVTYTDRPTAGSSGLSDLSSTIQGVSTLPRYVGPGVFNDAGRIYVRLASLDSDAVHGAAVTQLPSTNPNDVSLLVGSLDPVFDVFASHVQFNDFQVRGGGRGFRLNGAESVSINLMTFVGQGLGIDIQESSSDIVVEGSDFHIDFPDYLAWTDLKGGSLHSKPAAYWINRRAGISSDFVQGLTVLNNTFHDAFDGLVVSGEDIKIYRNTGRFIDDMVQLGSNSSHVEIFENEISGVGPSHHGRGDSENPGTIYIYSNTIDSRESVLWKKQDSEALLDQYPNFYSLNPFGRHNRSGLVNGDPWNIYNNTVLFDTSEPGASSGYQLWGRVNSTGQSHQVYNNIFLETGGGAFTNTLNLNLDGQMYDGNIYWSTSSSPAFHEDFETLAKTGIDFNSLAEFLVSSQFEDSKIHYSLGWDASSIQADPLLDADFVPSISGPASIEGVELPSDFPHRRILTYRGALTPQ